jgi:hypothetical protein
LPNLAKSFQSPSKLSPGKRVVQTSGILKDSHQHSDGKVLENASKRERHEQDDGFFQPKAGKIMRFVERLQHAESHPKPSVSHDKPSDHSALPLASTSLATLPTAPPVSNPKSAVIPSKEFHQGGSSPSQGGHEISSNRPIPLDFESNHSIEGGAYSPDLNDPFTSRTNHADETAKMRLNLAILTQTQHPRLTNDGDTRWYRYHADSPSTDELMGSLSDFDLPMKVYKDPFYSDINDVPNRKREYAGRQYTLLGSSLKFMKQFDHSFKSLMSPPLLLQNSYPNIPRWEFANPPPKLSDLRKTLITKREPRNLQF